MVVRRVPMFYLNLFDVQGEQGDVGEKGLRGRDAKAPTVSVTIDYLHIIIFKGCARFVTIFFC